MYRMPNKYQLKLIEDFRLPFGGKLNKNNRWIVLSEIIPWDKIEEKYIENFNDKGAPAKNIRIALGAILIKERLGITDRETVEQISENPYLQFFLGMKHFESEKSLFDASSMVHFRKRFGEEVLKEINEMIINSDENDDSAVGNSLLEKDTEEEKTKLENKGKLILDATCAPSDIKYPTDVSLLNEAREKAEKIIDILYENIPEMKKKPRTYREKARKEYMKIAKQRRARKNEIRKAIKKQLGFLRRDISIIQKLLDLVEMKVLGFKHQRILWIIQEVYRQQQEMYTSKRHSIEGRIVSISQPHIRPIVRGKRNSETEFGAKVSISLVDGYCRVEKLDWENFNEGVTLEEIVESYKEIHGYYPERILADTLYRNRANKTYCNERGISLNGPALGRKSKEKKREEIKQLKQDAKERNAVEGKFGEGKRKYGLGRIMAKLKNTSETVIMLQFIIMNLEHKLRVLFFQISDFIIILILRKDKNNCKMTC